jgi:ubiquinone/menaquinone biosynthesis C-methylase UbiE
MPEEQTRTRSANMTIKDELPAEIAFHPLQKLTDPEVSRVFSRILAQRFDTRILTGYFGLPGEQIDIDAHRHAEELLTYLIEQSDCHPDEAARRFRERFTYEDSRFPGVPKNLRRILKSYFAIKEAATDLLMITDLIEVETEADTTVADIGCGRNRLGKALLDYADRRSIRIAGVVGTDVNKYETTGEDVRLRFMHQESDRLPLDDDTISLAVIKWALHHMNPRILTNMAQELARVLKPGGRLAVVEALMGNESEFHQGLIDEASNSETWPDGEWKVERLELTRKYLALSESQQRDVLALEDYYGHWVDQAFFFMPLPFTYMNPAGMRAVFTPVGLIEDPEARRVFGMMPVIHWGPPSIRMIFVKQTA